MSGVCSHQKAFHHGKVMIIDRVFWCQCLLAKDTSVIGKLEFVAHCNEGKSVLRAKGGHLSKKG